MDSTTTGKPRAAFTAKAHGPRRAHSETSRCRLRASAGSDANRKSSSAFPCAALPKIQRQLTGDYRHSRRLPKRRPREPTHAAQALTQQGTREVHPSGGACAQVHAHVGRTRMRLMLVFGRASQLVRARAGLLRPAERVGDGGLCSACRASRQGQSALVRALCAGARGARLLCGSAVSECVSEHPRVCMRS